MTQSIDAAGEEPAMHGQLVDDPEGLLDDPEGVAETAREQLGEAVRAIAFYGADVLCVVEMAPSVRARYSEDELDKLAREAGVMAGFGDDHQEELYQLGELRYTLRGFEDGAVLRVPLGADNGVVVSVTPDADLGLPEFAGELRAANN
jgi:predicted regulator of Ras-like GTPase activity (Roadblock/LC7/MglB family)